MDFSDVLSITNEHVQLTLEERKQTTINSMWEAVREACKQIIISRRSAELTLGINSDQFDEELNKICVELNEEYGSMTEDQLHKVMLKEIIERIFQE